MTTTTTTTAPARLTAEWFKLGAIIVTTFVVCWTLTIGYWRLIDHHPGTGEIGLTLLALPIGVLLAFWASYKVISDRAAALPASAPTPAVSSPHANAAAASTPVLAIVATALRSPYGSSAEELASAIADNEARADLDQELVDDNGFPVMAARSDEAEDEALQDEIADWLSSQGLQVHLNEEQWRATILASGVAAELGSIAAGELLPCEESPPTLQLRLMLPQDWPVDIRRAVTMWLKHTVSQYGWPEAGIAVPDVTEQDRTSPASVISQLMPVASSAEPPVLALVIACASLIGQESIDRLAAQSLLFTAAQSRGQVPGEGAAGLLLTDLKLAQACGAEFVLLGPVNEGRRASSADDTRQVDSTLLLDLVEHTNKAAAVDISQISMVVADTAHRPNRVLELMGLSAPAIAQVDAADDIIRVGLGSGSCGAVPAMTVLALGRHYALERGAPVLCIGNEDPYLRSVTLMRPPA